MWARGSQRRKQQGPRVPKYKIKAILEIMT